MGVPNATAGRPIDWSAKTTVDEYRGRIFATKVCSATGEKVDLTVNSSPVDPVQHDLGGIHVSIQNDHVHLVMTRTVEDGPVTAIHVASESGQAEFYRGPTLYDEWAKNSYNSRYIGFQDTGVQRMRVEGPRPQANELGVRHVLVSEKGSVHVFTPLTAGSPEATQAREFFEAADRLAGQELSAKSCQALYSGYEALAAAAPKVAAPKREGWVAR